MPTLLLSELAPVAGRDIVAPMNLPVESVTVEAQRAWAQRPVRDRLQVIACARHLLAAQTDALCAAIPSTLARNSADTMCAEVLPLLAALKFLEHQTEAVLRPRILRKRGRPVWLTGVWSEVHRVPMGRIIVIAPSNYPLFLPGVQVAQALAAGNAAIWKPAPGGRDAALLFADTMRTAGLPEYLLQVTEDSIEAAHNAIANGVDKVFFTGSAASGRTLLKQLAETLTPCVAELSGCDAVFVLPSADLSRVVKALTFGMRLNGSATCMAPRRIILTAATVDQRSRFVAALSSALNAVDGVTLPVRSRHHLHALVDDAIANGAHLHGELRDLQQPLLIVNVTSSMRIAQADIFAPVLALIEARNVEEALAINAACPCALTAAIFGRECESFALAAKITAGTIVVNDLMVPAADPRTPFGGRGSSGFGTTQGAEGLLEMTAPKTLAVRRGRGTNHYDATAIEHERFFRGIIHASHLQSWRDRLSGLKELLAAAYGLYKRN